MKALVCTAFGPIEDLRVQEVAVPTPGEQSVRIQVHACGINFPDILLVQGKYQVRPPLPFFPGGEVAGTISALGSGVTGLRVGQRVMATIFWGGLAEEVLAPVAAVVAVPDSMDMLSAAVFQGGHTTAYHALRQRGALQRGETLLVLGAAGGVGMAAMQIGRAMGARVIGAVSSARKLEALRAEGFEDVIDYGRDDLREALNKLTGGQGADVIFDPVGGELFGKACRCARRNGRILIVGFASGQIGQYATNLALLKENAVIGVNYQQFFAKDRATVDRNFEELMALNASGAIRPRIDRVFALDEAVQALAAVADRSVIGKVVVRLRD